MTAPAAFPINGPLYYNPPQGPTKAPRGNSLTEKGNCYVVRNLQSDFDRCRFTESKIANLSGQEISALARNLCRDNNFLKTTESRTDHLTQQQVSELARKLFAVTMVK